VTPTVTPAQPSAELALLPSQLAAIRSTAPVVGRPAGYGSGKSFGLVAWAMHRGGVLHVEGGPDVAIMLVEPTVKQLRRVLLPRIYDVARACGLHVEHRSQAAEVHVDYGGGSRAVIYLASADRPTTLEGPTVAAVGIDEAGLIRSPRAYQAASARLRWPTHGMTETQRAWANQLHLCGTPEGTGTTFQAWCEGDVGARLGTEVIRGGTLENIWLPPSPEEWVAAKLGHLSDDEADAYVRGYFVASGGRVLGHFDEERNVRPYTAHPTGARLYMFADFGWRTSAWIFAAQYRDTTTGEDVIHLFDELIGRNTTTETHRERAALRWRRWLGGDRADAETMLRRVTVIPDETSPGDIALLRQYGYHTITPSRKNPTWQTRAHALNHHLRAGRLLVDGDGAPYALSCLRDMGWSGQREIPQKSTDDGRGERAPLDHGFDAIGYGVVRLAPVRPYRPGSDHDYD